MQISRSLLSLSLYKPRKSSYFSLLFFSSSSRREPIAVADYLLHRHQFSPETLAALSSSPVKYLKNPEKTDSILAFLGEKSFSKTQLEQIVKHSPHILSANLDRTIKPKIEIFQDLGLSPTDIAEIFSANPWAFRRSTDNTIRPSMLALKEVLGSAVNISRLLKTSGWFLSKHLDKSMIPNIEFLKSYGVSYSFIVKFIYNFPRFLLIKPEDLQEFARRANEMGCNRNSKMYLYALRVISCTSSDVWEHKWELFRGLGFSDDEIALLFKRMPHVFTVSDGKIKETTQILCNVGKFDKSLILSQPQVLLYSIERRIKPRLQVLEVLESKNLLRKKPGLVAAWKMSNNAFFNKYVLPYSDVVGKYFIPCFV